MALIKRLFAHICHVALLPMLLVFGLITMPLTFLGWNGYVFARIAWENRCSLKGAKQIYQKNPEAYRGSFGSSSTSEISPISAEPSYSSYDSLRDSPAYSHLSYNTYHHRHHH